jgi:hypothetical protein
MRRAGIALALAPLLVSGVFGIFALAALPMMFVISFAIGLPALVLLKRIECLTWWIAVLVGACGALCFITLNTLAPLTYGVAPNIDRVLDSNNIAFLGLGMLTAFVFWWIGIFRNAAFPFVPRRVPLGALLVFPLALVCVNLNHSLRQTFSQGRVTAIEVAPTTNPMVGQATVHLTQGPVVHADLSSTWPSQMIEGRCVHVEYRWSTLRFRRIYEVDSPFGGGVDDC